jgi:hypothetical protein
VIDGRSSLLLDKGLMVITKPSLHRVAVTKVLALLFGVSISCDMPIRNAMPHSGA